MEKFLDEYAVLLNRLPLKPQTITKGTLSSTSSGELFLSALTGINVINISLWGFIQIEEL
jgi:hypothetical protein